MIGTMDLLGTGATQSAGSVTDDDHDMIFTFNGLSGDFVGLEGFINVSLSESEDALGVDTYDVVFDLLFPYQGSSADIEYTLTAVNNSREVINSVSLGSDVAGQAIVTKDIFNNSINLTPLLAQLVSIGGNSDPASGYYSFPSSKTIYVVDRLNALDSINGEEIYSVSNHFGTVVPEPVTLALMGIGLAAFGARCRFA